MVTYMTPSTTTGVTCKCLELEMGNIHFGARWATLAVVISRRPLCRLPLSLPLYLGQLPGFGSATSENGMPPGWLEPAVRTATGPLPVRRARNPRQPPISPSFPDTSVITDLCPRLS